MNVTTYSYDAMNRETGDDQRGRDRRWPASTTNVYDKGGNQVTSTDPDDETTTTTYDAMDRESTVEDADGGVTTYTYDNDGRLVYADRPRSAIITTFLYDAIASRPK